MPCRMIGLTLGLFVLAAVGCHTQPTAPATTGADEAAKNYFEAVLRQDWAAAYALLHPDTVKRFSPEQFAQQAANVRQSMGFEPTALHVRFCEEHGEEAIAHVVFTGQSASHSRSYKDAATLRRSEVGWRVMLPPNFGRVRSK